MSIDVNKVVVLVNGVRYPIRTQEEPAYVRSLAEELDSTVHELMLKGNLSLNEALVLISLEYLDSYKKAERNLDNMRDQLTGYMEEAERMRNEAVEARLEVERVLGEREAAAGSK